MITELIILVIQLFNLLLDISRISSSRDWNGMKNKVIVEPG